MIGAINLWNPGHVTFTVDLVTAFLLGLVHGITPDEHSWPVTFSYAVGGHSTRRGLLSGLIFSLVSKARVFAVFGIGVTSFVTAAQAWRRRLLSENTAPATLNP